MFLNVGFSADWWYDNYDICFSREVYHDISKKLYSQQKMNTLMAELLRGTPYQQLSVDMGVVSSPVIGIEPFGHRFIPAMMGCEILYSHDGAPWAHNHIWSYEEILETDPMLMADFIRHPYVRLIEAQYIAAKAQGINCSSQQNLGSVINTAIYLRGMELFTDFYDNPEVVTKLYELITNLMELSYTYFCELDGKLSPIGVGNCSVSMLSPKIYAAFNRPFDLRMMHHAKANHVKFALHQDSNMTPFIEAYQKFDYLDSFDVGCDTDIAEVRKAFPHIIINVFLYVSVLQSYSDAQLVRLLTDCINGAGGKERIGFSAYDIDGSVSIKRVKDLIGWVYGIYR